jgi:NADPH:quinone reductase-like Zn-dependent oxidoreductase
MLELGGADVILDLMGAAYLDRNMDALAADGQLVIIGMQGGVKGELNIGKLIGKRTRVIGTALRGGRSTVRWVRPTSSRPPSTPCGR